MGTIGLILMFIPLAIAAACFIISALQFMQKGYLINSAYIFNSKAGRESMEKKPYYMQSGVIFLLIGGFFLAMGLDIVLQAAWTVLAELVLAAAAIIYAIVSKKRLRRR